MKLLFLTEFFPSDENKVFTGGVEARSYYTVNQAKKDFSIKVIASSSKQIPATNFSVFTRIIYLFIAFYKALITDFDLIEASNVVVYLPAWLAGKIKRKPVIIWVPDVLGKSWFDFGWFVGIFGYLMEKLYLSLSWDGVIALSHSTKTKLLEAKIKTKKITIVHGGIDPQEFKHSKKISKFKKTTICCIARLVKTKRIDILIKAFAALPQQSQLQLTIIGRGPQKEFLLRLIKENRLQEQVNIIDSLPRHKLIESLQHSCLFCLPSVVEGFGLATIEAMACGLPVVLADIPINQEITNFGQGCLFFHPDNPTDLTNKLKLLLTDNHLYLEKQQQAKVLASTYSWQKAYQQTKTFYETCLSL